MGLALVGLSEFYKAFFKDFKAIHLVGYVFTVIYYIVVHCFSVYNVNASWLLVVLTLFIIFAQTALVLFYKQIPIQESIMTVFGFFYVTFLLSFIVLTRNHSQGRYFVWLIFTSSFGCDTFAYITGMTFGRHKLTDTPSPRKSIEGVVGGVVGAALVGALYGYFVSHYFHADVQGMTLNATVVSLFGAVFSVIGDMSASAIKRNTKIKDFGKLFPGHGGVLDRFDSVIMTAPIVYMVMIAIIWLRS
jgi:phosphatidate cytidylyltransferase